ncbi:phosphoheptose isomerase [Bacterioplanes sanyensis]|uniref:Phosphoheptose isomerase n=1 Tax=Bacterioplanes sanyensis TaxID=1249553 RepID=A0A222FJ12_9GAMM|nr:SIS domain-containing protein [Bacterioplanes sanyensis]ASP38484.1 phosphoheptose isomerase [Bacterioplanes sanyensis]
MLSNITFSLNEAQQALNNLLNNHEAIQSIEAAAQQLITALEQGKKVLSCGNGGSMCDAMHFAEELTGRYRKDRPAYAAIAIADASHMSCVANDFGYEHVFSRYVQAHGREGDVLVALSTSGKSPSILHAAEEAQQLGMSVVVLSGRVHEPLQQLSDVYVCTPAGQFADRVQELHIKVLHIFIELIERHFHPENYQHSET